MKFDSLKKDRFLRRDADQSDQTKNATYTAGNPAPKRGDDTRRKAGRPKGSEEDDGAPNILTGTVITSCFIQTSALPSRIELQGNDLTFFDDTYSENGRVIGDTSRLIFTHGSAKFGEKIEQGFIMEKRASIYNTYDNVLSWYAMPAKEGAHNYMFIGRDAYGDNSAGGSQRNLSTLQLAVNEDTLGAYTGDESALNGIFAVGHSIDGDTTNTGASFVSGNTFVLTTGALTGGYSSAMLARGGGLAGIGYIPTGSVNASILLYLTSETAITIGADMIPDANGVYDIGSPAFKIATFYGSVVACPLPTVENALEILDRIPEPEFVGERGHYGTDRKYFDDLTFPAELLFTDKKGRVDIEHNHVLGFLLKAVIELKAEVDSLKSKTQNV